MFDTLCEYNSELEKIRDIYIAKKINLVIYLIVNACVKYSSIPKKIPILTAF
jgi:hypothetical protein